MAEARKQADQKPKATRAPEAPNVPDDVVQDGRKAEGAVGHQHEVDEHGKLAPSEAEAIMSADLPSGDPELTAPAEAADQSPDYEQDQEHERGGRKGQAA